MRFFSNEAQENVDDKNADGKADDRVDRDPAETQAVPQQRAGSPWQHDSDPTPQPTAVGTSPQPTVVGTAPQPTAVGTSPVAGAETVPDPADTDRKDTDEQDADKQDTDKKDTDKKDTHEIDADKRDTDRIDAALEDRGTFDDPHVGEPGPRDTGTGPRDTETGFPDAKVGSHDAKIDAPVDEKVDDKVDEKADEKATPEVTTPSGPAPFFPSADTQPMRDRWRDVQLRFVDDPKGATAEASGLVDEAVDKLSKALRDHHGSLAKGTDDTEQLRVEFRSYRDILDRLLGL
ncbi:hypothetical protein Ait01nite_021910 [Actinoplanes italicus]|uniref:Uncharacterized protein n=1 Tax=Actinoplanes italicus TaxID=113567 RepID=A0A2T0KNU5_9ACTN|nr:hypothetical protein [Actinoplanes italicus]PRX25413.1 hypothetical protein CLV67_101126 [Actinoplanes italicus]GIE29146.1 hypothetical protein Ait01nite_021910 [Actinoplanes italicus]